MQTIDIADNIYPPSPNTYLRLWYFVKIQLYPDILSNKIGNRKWNYLSYSHCLVDDFMLWNFVKTPFLAKDIVFSVLHSQTGNGVIEIGNGFIWTIQWNSHWSVDNFRLWNFVKSPFLAKDMCFQCCTVKQEMELLNRKWNCLDLLVR